MKRKGFTLIELLSVLVVLSIIGGIVTSIVTTYIRKSRETLAQTQKEKIIAVSKDWALKNTDKLDEYHLNNTYLSLSTLKEEGYLEKTKMTDPLTRNEMVGCVVISYVTSTKSYSYEYKEDTCDALTKDITYKTPAAVTIIDKEESNTNSSLIEENDYYVYKGSNPDNYIKIDNSTWRILKIDKDTKNIKVVKTSASKTKAWNENTEETDLTFKNSTLIENLKIDSNIVSDNTKKVMVENSLWYLGNITTENASLMITSSLEKQSSINTDVALLSIADYQEASKNEECLNNYLSPNCSADNYLNFKTNYWLINSDSSNIWKVNQDGYILKETNYQSLLNVYPVIYLDYSTQITGEGTESNPYVVGIEA